VSAHTFAASDSLVLCLLASLISPSIRNGSALTFAASVSLVLCLMASLVSLSIRNVFAHTFAASDSLVLCLMASSTIMFDWFQIGILAQFALFEIDWFENE